MMTLVLGGGCFWCVEAAFKLLPGVARATCGYAGGTFPNPGYKDVCAGLTGHAEVVEVEFDPAALPLERLLEHFWTAHDPTQVGGQGNDHGPQYRSVILFAHEGQRAAAEKSRAQAQKRFSRPITTEITRLDRFWPAEDYHQNYFEQHPDEGYCALVIAPKIEHLREALK
jgi:peptide-methionine (S)-S-oxide reductase